ncbi:MAG TPA: HDOD domain-containing protein [Verrucomicrobiae bacterium]|nr:HDOD domain-containing protein [Verrucomicrobiae bacterium]
MTPNEVIAKVKNLPAVSQAALKLVTLLDQPAVSNDDVVTVLKYDNVMTAKLLRACNSPYFGFEEKIASVEQAVLILGHQQILHMVLSLAFGGAMSTTLPGYAIEARELWSHSLTAAVAAEQLAGDSLPVDFEPPVAFTAGLLHDIGKLALHQVLDAATQTEIRDRVARDHQPRNQAEKSVLGTDHCEIGACLLEKWRLPDEIVEAVAHHHSPIIAPAPKLSSLVHVADCLVHLIGSSYGWDSYAMLADATTNQALRITPEKLESLMMNVHDSAGRVQHFMSLA